MITRRLIPMSVALPAVLCVIVALRAGWKHAYAKSSPQEPQEAVYAMLSAARAGDVKGYLNAFTGDLERSLKNSIAESTESGFARYLRESNADIKGIAVSEPRETSGGGVKLSVEYVYQNRNEEQVMYLEWGREGWRIARIDDDRRVRTLIPYGTPVRSSTQQSGSSGYQSVGR